MIRRLFSTLSPNDPLPPLLPKQRKPKRGLWLFATIGLGLASGYVWSFLSEFGTLQPTDATTKNKKKVIVLGTGWAAANYVAKLSPEYFDVTIVSPRNYFLFTPLLPQVTVGTVESRSIIEPIRRLCFRRFQHIKFYEAMCTEIDPKNNTIHCEDLSLLHSYGFDLPYDYLVVAVGSINNTFNTPGVVEYCHFIKQIPDARLLRNSIMDCFEAANFPGISDEQKKQLLSFVIVGGGPTGVEFAGELHDFLAEDLSRWYPCLSKQVSITLIQSANVLLNTYDKKISDFALKSFKEKNIDVRTNCRIVEVKDKEVVFIDKKTNDRISIPYGTCVWSAGIGAHPLVQNLARKITAQPHHSSALVTNEYLQVKGSDNIFAIGDCCTVDQRKLINRLVDIFRAADVDNDGSLTFNEFKAMLKRETQNFPQIQVYRHQIKKIFEETDLNHDGKIDEEEFRKFAEVVDANVRSLPATAQAATQEGKYLSRYFNHVIGRQQLPSSHAPFIYRPAGSFASLGGKQAAAELNLDNSHQVVSVGLATWFMWKSVYWSKQVSLRNRFLLGTDWAKTKIFGRDISRL